MAIVELFPRRRDHGLAQLDTVDIQLHLGPGLDISPRLGSSFLFSHPCVSNTWRRRLYRTMGSFELPYHLTTLGGGGQPTPQRLGLWGWLHTRACRGVVQLALEGPSTIDLTPVAILFIPSSVSLSLFSLSSHCLSDSLDHDPSRGYEKHVSTRPRLVCFPSISPHYAVTHCLENAHVLLHSIADTSGRLALYSGPHPPHLQVDCATVSH